MHPGTELIPNKIHWYRVPGYAYAYLGTGLMVPTCRYQLPVPGTLGMHMHTQAVGIGR